MTLAEPLDLDAIENRIAESDCDSFFESGGPIEQLIAEVRRLRRQMEEDGMWAWLEAGKIIDVIGPDGASGIRLKLNDAE